MPKKTQEAADEAVPLTPQVPEDEAPTHPHAQYEYEYGELRRCHLCGPAEEHLGHTAEQVWFTSLQDRARHILECHREHPIEIQRAKEILSIEDLWDSMTEPQPATFKIPIVGATFKNPLKNVQPQPSPRKTETKAEQKGFFRSHPILTLILLGIVGYGLYLIIMIRFYGYTF